MNAVPPARLLFDQVVKSYGERTVVDRVSLTLPAGQIVALAGVNGSGKSTLMRIAAGFVEPTAGSVAIVETDECRLPLLDRSPERRVVDGVNYLSQDRRVIQWLSTLETLRLAKAAATGRRVSSADVFDCLERLRLTSLLDRPPREMAPADVVRLNLARAYFVNARFVLADEPLAGLDSNDVAHCTAIFQALRDAGTGIMLTDHNWRPLLACADTAHVMENGTIVYSGTAAGARVSQKARRLYFRTND